MFSATVMSDILGALVFGASGLLLFTDPSLRHRIPWFILSYFITSAWAAVHALSQGGLGGVSVALTAVSLLRNLSWDIGLLFLFKQAYFSRRAPSLLLRATGAGIIFCLLLSQALPLYAVCITQIFLVSIGLLLLEQIYRNAQQEGRGTIKFFCIGLGVLLGHDYCCYVNALYLGTETLAYGNGEMVVLCTSIFGLAHRRWAYQMSFSRMRYFYPLIPVFCVGYAVVVGFVHYHIKDDGATFSEALAIMASGCLVLSGFLLVSATLWNLRLKKKLKKNFFKYRYDYREEWSHFSHVLFRNYHDLSLQERVIISLSNMVDSPGGVLYERQDNDKFYFSTYWGISAPAPTLCGLPSELTQYMEQTVRVINAANLAKDAPLQKHAAFSEFLQQMPGIWLIIPLIYGDKLHAVLVLTEAYTKFELNWEVFNLLKIAGSQAAGCLVQEQSAQRLAEAKQFEGFNKLSTFILHDLKNVVSQLSLILNNAEHHRHNPTFMDGVFKTLKGSVHQMEQLIFQINNEKQHTIDEIFDLIACVNQAVDKRRNVLPIPQCIVEIEANVLWISGNKNRLQHILSNIIQNAQEATESSGEVKVVLGYDSKKTSVLVEVIDTGRGMDAAFIRHKLFKPFVSTKGSMGMGIGVFEAKEYMHLLGGDLRVESTLNRGTHFSLIFPCNLCSTELSLA